MTTIPDGLPSLARGSHPEGGGQACIMELVSVIAGERWTDKPKTVHPYLRSAAILVNDTMTDEQRHLLMPLIGRFFGTNTPAVGVALRRYFDIGFLVEQEKRIHDFFMLRFGSPLGCQCSRCRRGSMVHDKVQWLSEVLDIAEAAMTDHTPKVITEADVARVRELVSTR